MSRVFVIGAGFSKAVGDAPLANELFELVYEQAHNDQNDQGPGQWQEDFFSFKRLISYLQEQAKPLLDFLQRDGKQIETSRVIPNLHSINIEYLCSILDMNINYCYIPCILKVRCSIYISSSNYINYIGKKVTSN